MPYRARRTVIAVTGSDLPAVFAALEAGRGVPPAPRLASVRAGLEEGRPAPDCAGTGLAHSFEETVPSEEEARSA